MKNFTKKSLKASNGITLIALVVTIIVLLILAGISIAMLSGDNSILKKGTEARERTGTEQIRERIRLAQMGAVANGTGNLTEANLRAALTQEFGESGYTLTDGDTAWTVKVGEVEESISKSGSTTQTPGGGNNALTLTANVRETESRATIIEVTAGEVPTEAEFNTYSESKQRDMFVKALGVIWDWPEATWNDIDFYGYEGTVPSEAFNALANAGDINNEEYSNVYDFIIKTNSYVEPATFTLTGGETITGTSAEFAVTKNGSYTISATQNGNSGTVSANVDKCKIEEYSEIQQSNYKLEKDRYEVWIPAGFAYGTSTNVGTVTTGFVITDSVETVNGKNYSNGNEFVWIPVDKENLTVGKTTKAMATNIGTTENPNYRGILYNFGSYNKGTWTAYSEPQQIEYSSTGYREPAYLTDSDYADASSYNTVGIQTNTMQDEYNAMIASIKQYGGFYVGRYEMGKDAYSKIGVTPTSADDDETKTWYGLYSKAKTYTNSKNSVTAEMIWGSQYDAMLNFGLTNTSDSAKVNANTNGNHSGKLLKTGIWLGEGSKTDRINNIFDLEGNMSEWTKEAVTTDDRVNRGGYFNSAGSLSGRSISYPNNTNYSSGSRLGLYIK